MPELPEVETVRRGLDAAIRGARIERVEVRRRDLRIPVPPDFEARTQGRRLQAVDRRAKYLLLHLDSGDCVIGHLGMSGRVVVGSAPVLEPGRHDHLIFGFSGGRQLVFSDPRRFGLMTIAGGEELAAHPLLAGLGPEPLGNRFNAEYLERAARGRRQPLKAFLLDQRVIAGVGNIYASEVLYRAGLSPRRLARSLPGARAPRLARAVRDVLADAVESGGSTLRDYVRSNGELGYFQHCFGVYERQDADCTKPDCKGVIRRIVQSGRSTFYCTGCQR